MVLWLGYAGIYGVGKNRSNDCRIEAAQDEHIPHVDYSIQCRRGIMSRKRVVYGV